MWQGRIVQVGPARGLYGRPATRRRGRVRRRRELPPRDADAGASRRSSGGSLLTGTATGEVDVLVRPEQVRLTPDDASPATVRDLEYFGHDRMLGVALATGTLLKARVAGQSAIRPGDRVRVEIIGAVAAFPLRGRA